MHKLKFGCLVFIQLIALNGHTSLDKQTRFNQAIALAEVYLQKAKDNPRLAQTSKSLSDDISLLKKAFENGVQLISSKCDTKETKNLIAYTYATALSPIQDWYSIRNGEKKVNKIYVCPRSVERSPNILAQNLIHEVSHLALQAGELKATGLEIAVLYFAGETPYFNGYSYLDKTWRFEGSSNYRIMSSGEAEHFSLEWLNFEEFANSKFYYEMNQLRSDIIFGIALEEISTILGVYNDSLDEVFAFRDRTGNSLLMIAAREGHQEVLKILLEKNPLNSKDKKQLLESLLRIAKENGRAAAVKFLQEY